MGQAFIRSTATQPVWGEITQGQLFSDPVTAVMPVRARNPKDLFMQAPPPLDLSSSGTASTFCGPRIYNIRAGHTTGTSSSLGRRPDCPSEVHDSVSPKRSGTSKGLHVAGAGVGAGRRGPGRAPAGAAEARLRDLAGKQPGAGPLLPSAARETLLQACPEGHPTVSAHSGTAVGSQENCDCHELRLGQKSQAGGTISSGTWTSLPRLIPICSLFPILKLRIKSTIWHQNSSRGRTPKGECQLRSGGEALRTAPGRRKALCCAVVSAQCEGLAALFLGHRLAVRLMSAPAVLLRPHPHDACSGFSLEGALGSGTSREAPSHTAQSTAGPAFPCGHPVNCDSCTEGLCPQSLPPHFPKTEVGEGGMRGRAGALVTSKAARDCLGPLCSSPGRSNQGNLRLHPRAGLQGQSLGRR